MFRCLMPPAFSEGKSAALPLSAGKVQEPDHGTQEQERGNQGAAYAESAQFVADCGIPWMLSVHTDGNVAQLVMDAA